MSEKETDFSLCIQIPSFPCPMAILITFVEWFRFSGLFRYILFFYTSGITPPQRNSILLEHSGHLKLLSFIITVRNNSCGKVMFSQAFVKNSVHWGGGCAWQGVCMAGGACMAGATCMAGGVCIAGGIHGGAHVWQGVCMAGGMHGGGCAWQGACMAGATCMAGGVCIAGGIHGGAHVWQGVCMAGGMHGGGCAWQGACMAGGVHGVGMHDRGSGCAWQGGGHAWQERQPLQRTVRILLECILVKIFHQIKHNNYSTFRFL